MDSLTFPLGDKNYYTKSGKRWCHLADRVVTLVRERSGNCYFTFQTRISCTGTSSQKLHTHNNPDFELNPRYTINFYNAEEGLLFFKDIETERYGPEFRYHGLTVRCEYDEEPIQREYGVGFREYDEVVYCNASIGRASLYYCSFN
jgi:hypothetical protein